MKMIFRKVVNKTLEERQKQIQKEHEDLSKNYTVEKHLEFVKNRANEYLGELKTRYKVEIIEK